MSTPSTYHYKITVNEQSTTGRKCLMSLRGETSGVLQNVMTIWVPQKAQNFVD